MHQYIIQYIRLILCRTNYFDIKVVIEARVIDICGFIENQYCFYKRFKKAEVYKIFNLRDFDSLKLYILYL